MFYILELQNSTPISFVVLSFNQHSLSETLGLWSIKTSSFMNTLHL